MYQDWFKVWRKITDSKVFANPHIFKLWVLCLRKANWTDQVILWEGANERIYVKRGQFVTGRESLHAAYYKVSRGSRKTSRTIWRWLKTLESWQCLRLESVQGITLVTLCNYGTYQDAPENMSNLVTTECPDDVQHVSSTCPDDVQMMSIEEEGLDSSKNNQEQKEETHSSSSDDDGASDGKPAKTKSPYTADFEEWWGHYPKKTGKLAASKAWLLAVQGLALRPESSRDKAKAILMEAVQAFAASGWGKSGHFVPKPKDWLANGNYEDDRTTWDRKEDNGKPTIHRDDSPARVRTRDFSKYDQPKGDGSGAS